MKLQNKILSTLLKKTENNADSQNFPEKRSNPEASPYDHV